MSKPRKLKRKPKRAGGSTARTAGPVRSARAMTLRPEDVQQDVRREIRGEYRKAGVSRTPTKSILGAGSISSSNTIKASKYHDPTRPRARADGQRRDYRVTRTVSMVPALAYVQSFLSQH